ncbi:uncharacterized protein LOC129356200 [Poeciliopsis prolifica]|uniref:uncharacterized protein LOC129356200 n=1 Tax=Poeciliopsis prolifica TaxID=188132 RepID=UPI0024143D1C|nr:uncharacterized protein LOC129356200 [Poeciliopsis prolifica]XP_054881771.1 uncharacterized protein LOC129356200 [Poeciliopsis prolifica]
MFKAAASAFVRSLNIDQRFVPNEDPDTEVDLLTLVRIKKGPIWSFPKYKVLKYTLPKLVGEKTFSPGDQEEVMVEDFKNYRMMGGNVLVKAGDVVDAGINADVVDAMTSVTIKKKKVDLDCVREAFRGRTIEKNDLKLLKLKKSHTLGFVFEMAYNTQPVTLTSTGSCEGKVSGSYQSLVKVGLGMKVELGTTFKIPERRTFAYNLVEIRLDKGKIEIPFETWIHKRGWLSDAIGNDILEKAREGIETKENILNLIDKLPEWTRGDVLKKLREVLEEEDTLTELEDMLHDGSEPPESKTVSSFMDILDQSKAPKARDGLCVLVAALDALPPPLQRPLISGSPQTVTVLNQLVQSLKDNDEPELSGSVPAGLQPDGDLRWAADLLSSSDEALKTLTDVFDLPPEVLLEVLALAVMGIHKLQGGE